MAALTKSLGDTLTLSDARVKRFVKALNDTLTLADSPAKVATFVRSSSDTLTLTESLVIRNPSIRPLVPVGSVTFNPLEDTVSVTRIYF